MQATFSNIHILVHIFDNQQHLTQKKEYSGREIGDILSIHITHTVELVLLDVNSQKKSSANCGALSTCPKNVSLLFEGRHYIQKS